MPWTIGYEPEIEALSVSIEGAFTLEAARRLTRDVLARAIEHSTPRFLVDVSALGRPLSTLEILFMVKDYEVAGVGRDSRIAVLLPGEASAREDIRFYQTAALNRGYSVQVFDEKPRAVAWLVNGHGPGLPGSDPGPQGPLGPRP